MRTPIKLRSLTTEEVTGNLFGDECLRLTFAQAASQQNSVPLMTDQSIYFSPCLLKVGAA